MIKYIFMSSAKWKGSKEKQQDGILSESSWAAAFWMLKSEQLD